MFIFCDSYWNFLSHVIPTCKLEISDKWVKAEVNLRQWLQSTTLHEWSCRFALLGETCYASKELSCTLSKYWGTCTIYTYIQVLLYQDYIYLWTIKFILNCFLFEVLSTALLSFPKCLIIYEVNGIWLDILKNM